MSSLTELRRFEIAGRAEFAEGRGGLPCLRISTASCAAEVYLHGAHATHFQPTGAQPVLFMSGASSFSAGKPIRGGVPVIFPWFGARAGRPDSPAHGFARTLPWSVESLTAEDGDAIALTLRLEANDETRVHWPHEFILRHRMLLTSKLEMNLEVENRGDTSMQFEEALHTYLAVADVRNIRITGLEDTDYFDKVDGMTRKSQSRDAIEITGETDRIYVNTRSTCSLDDPNLARRIVVEKSGSDTTVVWNPWIAKARAMADFGDDEWPAMMCIETANAGDSAITLAPGSRHIMTATISL